MDCTTAAVSSPDALSYTLIWKSSKVCASTLSIAPLRIRGRRKVGIIVVMRDTVRFPVEVKTISRKTGSGGGRFGSSSCPGIPSSNNFGVARSYEVTLGVRVAPSSMSYVQTIFCLSHVTPCRSPSTSFRKLLGCFPSLCNTDPEPTQMAQPRATRPFHSLEGKFTFWLRFGDEARCRHELRRKARP